jgi:hypothetical protein
MDINIIAVIAATAAQFVVGMIWYAPLFGKLWGQIHGFDQLSKETQKEMMAKMGPFYGLQLLVTVFTAFALAKLMVMLPEESPYMLATLVWFGFVIPTQVSAVVFGGTEPKWIVKKVLVMAGGSLVCLLAAAAVLGVM